MINWVKREEKLKKIIKPQKSEVNSYKSFSKRFSNWYHNTILEGNDSLYQNTIKTSNKKVLKESISLVLSLSQESSNAFESALESGIVGYWASAQLSSNNPPPGSTKIITNIVIDPGQFNISLPPRETINFEVFFSILLDSIKLHLNTIKGITKAQTGQGVIDYPWTGYV